MPTIRYEIYSMIGNGGMGLAEQVEQAEGYADVKAGAKLTTDTSWQLVWQNTTRAPALAVLRNGSSDHVARIDLSTPGNNSAAFSIEQDERRLVLVKADWSLYVKQET